MRSVGSYEAKTHLPRLLSQVEKGETITITKRGKPIAALSPAQAVSERDVSAVIAQLRAYSQEHARTGGQPPKSRRRNRGSDSNGEKNNDLQGHMCSVGAACCLPGRLHGGQ